MKNIGDKVFIPRLSLIPYDVRILFKFQLRQFPLMVSFAMNISYVANVFTWSVVCYDFNF
jgi:hypothetical protein